jgi:hypothetical protein
VTALTGAELRARFGEAPMLTMGEAGDALRKLGLRDQVHPRDVVGFRYATQEGWDESARSNLEHHGHADLGSFVTGEGVTGLVDIRHAMPEGQLTDPSKPDDWDPHTEREAAAREALKAMGYWLDRLGGSYVIGSEGRSHLLPGRTFPFLRDLEKFIKDRSQPVASKAVQSSGNTGPRDASEQVHSQFVQPPAPVAPLESERASLLRRVGNIMRSDWSMTMFDGRDVKRWINTALDGDADALRELADELTGMEDD